MSSTTADAAVSPETVAAGRPGRKACKSVHALPAWLWVSRIMTGRGARWRCGRSRLIHNAMFNGVFKIAYDANILKGPSRLGNWVILSPILGGLVVVYLVERFAPEARRSWRPRGDGRDLLQARRHSRRRRGHQVAGLGPVDRIRRVGRPGGADHPDRVGAGIGVFAGHWAPRPVIRSPSYLRLAGAGIAATFNTPLGGVLFAIEIFCPKSPTAPFCPSSSRRVRRRSSGACSSAPIRPSPSPRSSFRPQALSVSQEAIA